MKISKIFITALSCAVAGFCVAVKAAPVMASNVEQVAEITVKGEESIGAVLGDEIKPGLNLLTETAQPLDFTNGLVSPFEPHSCELSVTDSPVSGDVGNKALMLSPTSKWNAARFNLTTAVEKERPIKASLKAYKKTADSVGTDNSFWIMKNGTSVWQKVYTYNSFASNTGEWIELSYVCDTFDKLTNTSSGALDTSDTNAILLEWTVHSDICDSSNKVTDSSKQTVYFDDISFVPAHKITYMDDKDAVIRTEYKFLDTDTDFVPVVTAEDKDNFIEGWTLTQNSAQTVQSIDVTNSDIVLYAVYSDEIKIQFEGESNLIDAIGKTITVSCKLTAHGDDVSAVTKSFSVAEGGDVVSVKDNGNGTFGITSLKEGFATVKCTLSTGEENSFKVAVKPVEGASNVTEKRIEIDLTNIAESSFKLDHKGLSGWDEENEVFVIQRDSTVSGTGFVNFWQTYSLTEYPYIIIEMKCESATSFFMPMCDNDSKWHYYTNYGHSHPSLAASDDYTLYCVNMQEKYIGTDENGQTTFDSPKGFVLGITNHYKPVYIKSLALSNVPVTQESRVIKLETNKNAITSDAEKIEFSTIVFSNKTLDSVNLQWSLDNNNAVIIDNGDGTATLAGLKNGTVTVTVKDKDFPENSDSLVVTISGQREKMPVYDLRVLFWGCSTLVHGPSTSLGWTGNWGMAASSKENDYAHKLIKYLEEEFAPCNVTFQMSVTGAGYDQTIKADTDNTVDYTQTAAYSDIKKKLDLFKPNIFIAGQTENLSSTYNVEAGKRAYRELYEMIYSNSPNIIALQQHCGISHAPLKEEINDYIAGYFKDRGFIRWHTDMPGNPKYYAPEWNEIGQPGVAGHPGDYGMDYMARTMLSMIKEDIYSKIEPSDYIYLPESIEITGSKTINTQSGTVELDVKAAPSDSSDEAVFTVDNENIATVDENGVVTAKNNGTVIVTATSKYDKTVTATFTITVTGQPQSYTVTYDSGCDDDVTNLPAPTEYVRKEYNLSGTVPSRKYYTFNGWSTEKYGKEKVTCIDVSQNTTIYATWTKTEGFEFDGNYDEFAGYLYDFNIAGGFHAAVTEGRLSAVCSLGEKVRFISPDIDVTNKGYAVFNLESKYFDEGSSIDVKITDSNGESITHSVKLTDDVAKSYAVETRKLGEKISGIEIYVNAAPEDDSMFSIYIDYIRFADRATVDRHGYITTYSEISVRADMPLGIRVKASSSKTANIVPSVTEYGFIVTTMSMLADGKVDELTLNDSYVSSGKVVRGVAYSKADNINVVFENKDDETVFAGVLYGIPQSKTSYTETIVFRPYYKVLNSEGKTEVYYGAVKSSSLYEAAKEYLSSDITVNEEALTILRDIVRLVEE